MRIKLSCAKAWSTSGASLGSLFMKPRGCNADDALTLKHRNSIGFRHVSAASTMDLLEVRVRVIDFNTAEDWSLDMTEDVAHKTRRRCDLQGTDVPAHL